MVCTKFKSNFILFGTDVLVLVLDLQFYRISQMVRVRNVVHIPAQIERVGEDALPLEAVMRNHLLNAELLTKAKRSFSSVSYMFSCVHLSFNI